MQMAKFHTIGLHIMIKYNKSSLHIDKEIDVETTETLSITSEFIITVKINILIIKASSITV